MDPSNTLASAGQQAHPVDSPEFASAESETPTRKQVHELRNRLYAASLAFRAICKMLDTGNPKAARAAAETMLASLADELQDTQLAVSHERFSPGPGKGTRILLVEDDDMEAQLLSDYLDEHGYIISRACDGIDALTQLKRDPVPDIVLLDINMPRLDGTKTITSIRADKRFDGLILIVVSGTHTSTPDLQRARRQVDFWITKPADPARIVGAILELAGH